MFRMEQKPLIEIILATYNGEKHLHEQMLSLISQDYPNIRILVGDDASTDSTRDIIETFRKQYPDKVVPLFFKQNVGIINNFSRTLELSEAPYLMFADQDDIWFHDKVSKTMTKMEELEKKWGSEQPLLIHTDAQVVDENLNLIAKSNWEHQGFSLKKGKQLPYLLIQNWMQGCTMLFNRALCDLATPIPVEGFVHDYWLGLVAMSCGHIDFLPESTLLYRQHGSNRFGAIRANWTWFRKSLVKPDFLKATDTRLMRGTLRAYVLYKRYENLFSDKDREMIQKFIELKYVPLWKELWYRFKYGFFFHSVWRNLVLIMSTISSGRVDPKYRLKI